MISLLRNYDIKSIKNKFLILFILNALDLFFTKILIGIGFCYEGNIFIRGIIENNYISILFKIFIPAILLFCLSHRIKSATILQLKRSNTIISLCIFFYIFIVFSQLIFLFLSVALYGLY